MAQQVQRLRRSIHNRSIAGVCGGLGEYFGIDPTVVRVASVILAIPTGLLPAIFLYLVLWAVIPEREYHE